MKIKTIILLCLIYQVLQTYGLVQLKNSLATSDSPLLMKILQLVDAATSNEHLLEVTLKLLRSLCVCMRETLKVKEENYLITNSSVEPNESHITDGKVLELYRNIYNNTCINLRQELTNRSQRYIAEEESTFLNHTSCGKDENNKTHITTGETDKDLVEQTPLPSKSENILLKALIQTRHLHKYRIKKYNLLDKSAPITKSTVRHNLIVILTLHPDGEEVPSRTHSITEEELNKTLYTDSPIGIDIIDKKHDQKHKSNEEHQKPEIVSDCNLQSLYIFLTESERNNPTKMYKYMRKRETIKMYIEVNTSQNHSDYLNMCCYNGTSTPQCTHDAHIPLNMSNEKHNKTNLLRHYRNTITRIKKLVKLYEIKLNDTKDLDIPNDHYKEENKHTSNIELTTEDSTTKEDRARSKENDINKLVLNSNDTTQLAEVTKAIVLLNDFVSKQTTQHYLQTVEVNHTNIDKAYTEKPSINTEIENLQPNGTHVYNQTKMEVPMGVNNEKDKYHTTLTNSPYYYKSNDVELTTYFKPNRTSNSNDFLETIGVTAPMILEAEETTIALNLKDTIALGNVNDSSTLEVSEAIDNIKQPIAVDIGEDIFAGVVNNTVTPITIQYDETKSFISPQINDQNTVPPKINLTPDITPNNIIANNNSTNSYDELSASTDMNMKPTINDVNNEETKFTETFNREVTPTIIDYEATNISTPSSIDLNTKEYAGDVIENNIVTITSELNSEDETTSFTKPSTYKDNVNSFDVDVVENTILANTSTITAGSASDYDIESKSSTDLIDAKFSVKFIDSVTLGDTLNNTMTTELGNYDKTVDFKQPSVELNSTKPSTADVTDKTNELERDDKTIALSSKLTLDLNTAESSVSNITENSIAYEREDDKTLSSLTLLTTDLKNAEFSVTDIIENKTNTFELASNDGTINFTTQSPIDFTGIEASLYDATIIVNTLNTTTATELNSDAEVMTSAAPSTIDINFIKSSIIDNAENTTHENVFNFITASDDEIMDFALPLNTGTYFKPDSFVQNDDIFDKNLMLDRKNYTDDTDIESFTEEISTFRVTPNETPSIIYTSTADVVIHANKTIANLNSETEVTENIKPNLNTNIDSSESVASTSVFINVTDNLENETNIQSTTLSTTDSIGNILTSEEQVLSSTPAIEITKSTNTNYSKNEFNHELPTLKEDEVTAAILQEIPTIATSNNTKIDLNTTFDKETKETVSIDFKNEYQTMNTTYLDYVTHSSKPSPMILGTIEDLITSNESVTDDTENTGANFNKTELGTITTNNAVPTTLAEYHSTLHEEDINETKYSVGITSFTKTVDFNENVTDNLIGLNMTDNSAAEDQTDRDRNNTFTKSNESEIDNQNVTTNYFETTVTTEQFVVNYTDINVSPEANSRTANYINNYSLSDIGEDTTLNIQVPVPSTKLLPEKENTFEPTLQTFKIEENYDRHSSEVNETVSTYVNTEANTKIKHDVQISTDITETVETSTKSLIQNLTTETDIIQDTVNTENVDKVQFSPDSTDVTTEGNFSTPNKSLEINNLLKITTQVTEKTNQMVRGISLINESEITKYDSDPPNPENSSTKLSNKDSNEHLQLTTTKEKDEDMNSTPNVYPTFSEDYTTIAMGSQNHSHSMSDFRDNVKKVGNISSRIEPAYNLSPSTPGEETEFTHISNTTNENTSSNNRTEKVHYRISEDELSTTWETETKEMNLTSFDNNSADTLFSSNDLTTKQISIVNSANQSFTVIPTLSLSTQDVFNYIHTIDVVKPNEILTTFTSETTNTANISNPETHDDFETHSPSVKDEDETNASDSLKTTFNLDIENKTDKLFIVNSTVKAAEEAIITTVEATKVLNNLTKDDNIVSQTPVYDNKEETTLTTESKFLNTGISTTISPDEENSGITIKSMTLGKPVDTDSSSFLLQPLLDESMEKSLENISIKTVTPELTTIQSFETSQLENTSDVQLTTTEVTEIKDLDTIHVTTTSELSDNDNQFSDTINKTFDNGNESMNQSTEYVLMQFEPDTSTATYNNKLSTMTERKTGPNTSNETISYETKTETTPTTKLLSSNVTESTEYKTTLPKIELLPTVKETSKNLKTSKGKKILKHPVAFELNIRVGVEANQEGIKFTVLGKQETAHNLSGFQKHQQIFANHSGRIVTPPIRSESIFKSEITLGKEKNKSKPSLHNQLKDIVWTNMSWNRKSNYDQQADLARISTILNKLTWNPLPTVNINYTENMNNTSITQTANQPKENVTNETRRVDRTTAYTTSTTNKTFTTLPSNFTNVKHKSKVPGALTQTPAINNIKSIYMKHLKKIKESMAFNKDENITAADVLSKIYEEMKLHPMGEIEIQNRSRSYIRNTNNITLHGNENERNLNSQNDTISNASKLKKKNKLKSKGRKVKAALKKLLKGKKLTKKQLRKLTKKILKKNLTKMLDKKTHHVKNKFNITISNDTDSSSNKTTLQPGNVTKTQNAVNITSLYVNNVATNITTTYVSNVAGNITNPFKNATRKSKENNLIKEYKQQMKVLNKTGSYFLSGTRRKFDNSSESNDMSKLKLSNINSTHLNTTTDEVKYELSKATEKNFQTNTLPNNTEVITTIPTTTKEILKVNNNNEKEFQTTALSTDDFQQKMSTTVLEDSKSTSLKSITIPVDHIRNSTEITNGVLTTDIDKVDHLIYKLNGVNANHSTLAHHDVNVIKTEKVTNNTHNEFSKYTVSMPTSEALIANNHSFELHIESLTTISHSLHTDKNEKIPNKEPRDEENPVSEITITVQTTETHMPTTMRAADTSRQYDNTTILLEKDMDEINNKTWNITNNSENSTTLGSGFSDRNIINTTDIINTEEHVHNIEKVVTIPEVTSTANNNTLSDQDSKEISVNVRRNLGAKNKHNIGIEDSLTEEVREITTKTEKSMSQSDSINYKTTTNLSSEMTSTITTTQDGNVIHGTDGTRELKEETEVNTTDESLTTPYPATSLIQSNENNKETNNSLEKLTSTGNTPSSLKGIDANLSSIEEEIDHYKSATVTNSYLTSNDSNVILPLLNLTNNLIKLTEYTTDEGIVNERKTPVYDSKEVTTLSPKVHDVIHEPNIEKDFMTTTKKIHKDFVSSNTEVLSKNQAEHLPTSKISYNKFFHDSFDLTEQTKLDVTTPQVTSSEHTINLDQNQRSTINVNTNTEIAKDEGQETTIKYSTLKENITVHPTDQADKHLYVTNKNHLQYNIYQPRPVIYVPTSKSLLLYGHQYNYRATSEKPIRLPKIYILDQDMRQTVLNRTIENKYSSVKSITSLDLNSKTNFNGSNMTNNMTGHTTPQYKEYMKLLDNDNANTHTTQPYTHSISQKRFQVKSNNNNLRPFGTTNNKMSSNTQYYNFKAHDSLENNSVNQTHLTRENETDIKLYSTGHSTNHYDTQHYPIPFDEIRFRSEQANLNDTARNGYQNNNERLSSSIHTKPTKAVKETRIQIYSSHVHRQQVTGTTSTPTTKSIKYNTYQPTTKEDLELLKYQDGVPLIKTPTLNPTNPGKIQPQEPKLNNSCAILRNISDKFTSKDEFIKILKAANCTEPLQINLTDGYPDHKGEEMYENNRQPIEIIKIPQTSEIDNHHPILEININSPQIGTNGASPAMIEISGNPLPMEIHGHSLPLSVQGSSPQATNLPTNLVPINQNIPYSNDPNINMEPMQTIQVPQPQNFYGNSPGLELDRNSKPRLSVDRNTMLVGMPNTPQNTGNLLPMLSENNMMPPSTLELNKKSQQNGLNRLTSSIISPDHKYFSDINEPPYMSANVDNSAAISDNDKYFAPVENNNFNSPVQPAYTGGSPTMIENNWNPTLVSNNNRNLLPMMNTNIYPQSVIVGNRNSPGLPPTVTNNGIPMMNFNKTLSPMAKDNGEQVKQSTMFINSNSQLPLLAANPQNTLIMTDDYKNKLLLNNTNPSSIDNTREPQYAFNKYLNSEILIGQKRNPVLIKTPKMIDNNWNTRVTSNDKHLPVIINHSQNVPTLTENNNKNSALFNDKHLFTFIYNNKNPAPAASSKINSPTTTTNNNKHVHTLINHPLYENTRKAINKKLIRNRGRNVITRPMLETNIISVPILETRKSGNAAAPANVPFVSIDNVKNSLPISGKGHSSIEINRNTNLNIITQNLKKLKSTSGTLLDPFEKKNPYSVKMLPVKSLKTPMQRAQSKRMSVGNRRMAVMTMNTQDFFSQHRFVTAKPPPLMYKPLQSGPGYMLRPKFANIDKAARRFEHRRQPVYLKPKDYVVEPINDNVKYYKKVPVRRKVQQGWNNNMASVRQPTMRPSFVKNRVHSRKSLFAADYQRMTRRPAYNGVLRVPEEPDTSDNYSPAPFYHRRREDNGHVTTEAARTPRRRRTIFFLSPTVPYNQYE